MNEETMSAHDMNEVIGACMGAVEDTMPTLINSMKKLKVAPLDTRQYELVKLALVTAAMAGIRQFAAQPLKSASSKERLLELIHAETLRVENEEKGQCR
jgi:hypothetical protein